MKNRLYNLFKADSRSHVTCKIKNLTPDANGKIKGDYCTIHTSVTEQMFQDMLQGEYALHLSPLLPKNFVRWGCIDVDYYKDTLPESFRKPRADEPFVLGHSKSGAIHLYVFVSEAVPAQDMIDFLHQWALNFGLKVQDSKKVEIFPKRAKYIKGGSLPAPIGLPYELKDPKLQEDWIKLAESKQMTAEEFQQKFKAGEYEGLPPCVKAMISYGLPEGQRNAGLFAIGTALRRKFSVGWKDKLEEIRNKISEEIDDNELNTIIQSIDSIAVAKLGYQCDKDVLSTRCDKDLCRKQSYGATASFNAGTHKFNQLTKINTDPPTWILKALDNKGNPVDMSLTTEQLSSKTKFKQRCIDVLSQCPDLGSQKDWEVFINALLADANIYEVPYDATLLGRVEQVLKDFIQSNPASKDIEEIINNRIYVSKDQAGNIWYAFKNSQIQRYLRIIRINDLKDGDLLSSFKKLQEAGKMYFRKLQAKNTVFEVWQYKDNRQNILWEHELQQIEKENK